MTEVVPLPQPVAAQIVGGFAFLAGSNLSPRQPVTVTGIFRDLTAFEIEISDGNDTRKQRLRTNLVAATDDEGKELLIEAINRLKSRRPAQF